MEELTSCGSCKFFKAAGCCTLSWATIALHHISQQAFYSLCWAAVSSKAIPCMQYLQQWLSTLWTDCANIRTVQLLKVDR